MQCSNCQFQNMPGVQNLRPLRGQPATGLAARSTFTRRREPCGKAGGGGSLDLLWRAVAAAVTSRPAARCRGCRRFASDMPAASLLLRMIVPGWAQRYVGRAPRKVDVLGPTSALLFAGLLFARHVAGLVAVGIGRFGPRGFDHWTSWPHRSAISAGGWSTPAAALLIW